MPSGASIQLIFGEVKKVMFSDACDLLYVNISQLHLRSFGENTLWGGKISPEDSRNKYWFLGEPFVYWTVVLSVCPVCPVCDVGVLWPNGWTDQDETWHASRPQSWPHCVK